MIHEKLLKFPWFRKVAVKPHRITRNVKKTKAPKPSFHLRLAIMEFNRTKKLPVISGNLTVDYILGLEHPNINSGEYKKFKQALLLRAGDVERNPGPNGLCHYGEGDYVRGDKIRNGNIVRCRECMAVLQRVIRKHGECWGFHPATQNELGGCFNEDDGASSSGSSSSNPVLTPAPLNSSPFVTTVEVTQQSATLTQATCVNSSTARLVNTNINNAGTVAINPKPVPSPLCGQVLDDEDKIAIMQQVLGYKPPLWAITSTEKLIPYLGENRIATHRNVEPIKAPLKVVQLCVRVPPREFLLKLMMFSLSLILVYGLGSSLFNYWLARIENLCAIAIAMIRSTALTVAFNFSKAIFYFCAIIIIWVLYFWRDVKIKPVYLAFVPHLVSTVACEYESDVDAKVIRETLNMRMRRVACLPIPDVDMLMLIRGSAIVISHLVSKRVFRAGVTCLQ